MISYDCKVCHDPVGDEVNAPEVPLLDSIEAVKEGVCLDCWRLIAGRSREVETGGGDTL